MNFRWESAQAQTGDLAIVKSSHKCFVRLLDDANLGYFKRGQSYHGYGGYHENFPVRLVVPSAGHWTVVVYLPPGRSAQMSTSIVFFRPPGISADL